MIRFKLIPTKCALCETRKNYQIVYKNNIKHSDLNQNTYSARRVPDKAHPQIVKCKKCGLVRSNPMVPSKILTLLYKKSLFNYGTETENLVETYIKASALILKKIPKNGRILEIGCGNGFLLKHLFDKGYKNIFGIELSKDAVSRADKKIKKNIKIDTLKKGQFRPNFFDLIFFFQTLDHIPDPNQFLKICHKILSPNGYILAFNHNIDSLSSKILKNKSPIIDIEHTYLYSPQTIRMLFEKNGFNPLKIYSPNNIVSLRHLIRLLPISKVVKLWILNSKRRAVGMLLNKNLVLKLGNLCIVSNKLTGSANTS